MSLVPTMANALINAPEREQYDLSSLVTIHIGGAAASPELIERVEKAFHCPCLAGYGLTETAPVATSARKKGGNVKLVNLNQRTIELLVMTRLATAFETFNDEQDAINSYYPDRKLKTFDILDFVQKMKQGE